mmetsp:Transcript_112994/g.300174  ORF Transcript_112994/g.300174 Transcript_112994/m.300174 type:complete len:384 (+) Transcript_112994:224-1375(+)
MPRLHVRLPWNSISHATLQPHSPLEMAKGQWCCARRSSQRRHTSATELVELLVPPCVPAHFQLGEGRRRRRSYREALGQKGPRPAEASASNGAQHGPPGRSPPRSRRQWRVACAAARGMRGARVAARCHMWEFAGLHVAGSGRICTHVPGPGLQPRLGALNKRLGVCPWYPTCVSRPSREQTAAHSLHAQEQLQRDQRVAAGGVGRALASQSVLLGQACQRPVRQPITKLKAVRAELRKDCFECSDVARQALAGQHLQEVAQVVQARKGDPLRRNTGATTAVTQQLSEPTPKVCHVDALHGMPLEVDAGRAEEGQRVLVVEVEVLVEAQVEGPDATELPIYCGKGQAQLDRLEHVDIVAHDLVLCASGGRARSAAQAARELDV